MTGTPVGDEDASAAVRWLVEHGATVIDLSGITAGALGPGFDGVRYALANDVVVVMAYATARALPETAGVITVGGLDREGRRPSTACDVAKPILCAPGTGGMYGLTGAAERTSDHDVILAPGDSIAAALISGIAALVRAKYPELAASWVVNRLIRTSRDAGPSGRDDRYGYGIIDPVAALSADLSAVAANPLGNPGPPDGSPPGGAFVDGVLVTILGAGAVILAAVAVIVVLALVRRRRIHAGAQNHGARRLPQRG